MANERKFVSENIRRVLLKEYFRKETEMAGFGGIDIQRTPMGTRVTLNVERPGMVIGRKGAKIKDLTRVVQEVYGFDNPQIEVQECRNPSKNSQIMAQKLAIALERGWHFRRAGHSTLRRIGDTDVKGCQVKLSGKLTGQRHRTEKFKYGHIKFCGEPALTTMDRGFAVAKKKLGVIGVSVDIMRSDSVLPDEVTILDVPTLAEVAELEVVNEPKAQEASEDAPSVEAEGDQSRTEGPEEETSEKKVSKRKQKRIDRKEASGDENADEDGPSKEEVTVKDPETDGGE